MRSCLKAKPEIVPGSLTTAVTTQLQPTSEVSPFEEVETVGATTVALKPPVAFGMDPSELKNAPDVDVSALKDAPDFVGDHEVASHARPTRRQPFFIGTADEKSALGSFSVNRTQDRLATRLGEPAAKADDVYPDTALSGPQVPDICSEGALSGVEWYRRKQREPHPTTSDTELRGQLKMRLEDYIYFNPVGKPMSHKAGVSSAEEDIGSTELDSAAPANATLGSAIGSGPKPAKVRVTASFNDENTLDSQTLPMQLAPRTTTRTFVHDMGIPEANYSNFQKRRHAHRWWTADETARFYRALKVFGTDFDLMTTAFPNRTHKSLKNKFKREERDNRQLVQKIINDPTKFNLEGFEDEFSWPKGKEPKQEPM
ncbi:hypothetical protein MTO96_027341 [Rhipicephalus appendiculatus]